MHNHVDTLLWLVRNLYDDVRCNKTTQPTTLSIRFCTHTPLHTNPMTQTPKIQCVILRTKTYIFMLIYIMHSLGA